jgi:hypothetical protein
MPQCPERTALDDVTWRRIQRSPRKWPSPPLRTENVWLCDLDERHPGRHITLVEHGGGSQRGVDLWVEWMPGSPPQVIERPVCRSRMPGPPDMPSDGPDCFLVDDHPGQHSAGPDARW